MLTEKENEKASKELSSCLEKVGIKSGLIYLINPENDGIFEKVKKVIFQLGRLPNAMYPNINVDLYNENMEQVGRMGFTKQEYFHVKLADKDIVFGPDMMYDVKFLKQFKEHVKLEIDAKSYLRERDELKAVLADLETVIKENKLEG